MAREGHVVLAVDDDRSVLEALAVVLEQDYQVLRASDGHSALEVFHERNVDAVLLDILLPGLSGLDVLERMKAEDPLAEVLLVTAVTDVPHVVLGMKLGAADYITKPWDDDYLHRQVAAAVRRRAGGPDVLLIGSSDHLFALQLVLEHRVGSAAYGCARDALASSSRDFKLVLFDSDAPARDGAIVRALRERFGASLFAALVPDPVRARLIPEFRELPPWALVGKPYRLDVLVQRIAEILASRGLVRRAAPALDAHLSRAISFMTEHYREPLGTFEIAAAAGTSADHLGRLFHNELALTVKDFLARLRVSVAGRLLKETDEKLEDVAERVGFGDVGYFSRVFMQHAGVRPGLFRRREAGL